MSRDITQTITSCCSANGAALNLSFDASEILEQMTKRLENRLLKKGNALQWVEDAGAAQLAIRVVEIDQGNQFLRWLLPFIAPAVVEVEGEIRTGGAQPQSFHYVQRAQMGLFGGAARGMLKICATRVADRIASDVVRAQRS